MAWVSRFAHQLEGEIQSERPEAMLFDQFPDLAYLLFEATDTLAVVCGFDPDEIGRLATYIEDTGMCPEEFGTFDCMDSRLGAVVRNWKRKHGAL